MVLRKKAEVVRENPVPVCVFVGCVCLCVFVCVCVCVYAMEGDMSNLKIICLIKISINCNLFTPN